MAKEDQQLMQNNNKTIVNNNNNHNNNPKECNSMACLSSDGKPVRGLNQTIVANNRVSLQRLSAEKRAKRLKFFVNGDKYFKGIVYAFNEKTVRTFDALIQDLNRLFGRHIGLPTGVRFMFSTDGTERVTSLEQLHQSMSYVVSSTDNFVRLDYDSVSNISSVCANSSVNLKNTTNNINMKKTCVEITDNQSSYQSTQSSLSSGGQQLNLQSNQTHSSQTSSLSSSSSAASPTPKIPDFIRPKIVTIFRNGVKPRKAVRLLLNKRTAQTYDKVLSDITNAIKLDCGAVRKIYTLSGNQISSLADFFSEEDVFIAFGTEKHTNEDLELDSEESKYLNTKTSSLSRSVCNRNSKKSCSPLSVIYGPLTNGKSVNTTPNQNSPKIGSKLNGKNTINSPLNCNFAHNGGNGYSVSILFPKEVIQQYEIGQIIGDGNFAVVHQCSHKTTRTQFALKIINKSKCKGKEAMIASEVAILRKVKHTNIIQLIDDFDFTNELYLVMELVKGGDLFDAITLANKYTEVDAVQMIHDLASALNYLHTLNIVHRDVKPENLLISDINGVKSLKLGDFGLAVEIEDNEKLYSVCGTPTYVAPEILSETGYGKEVDIWAAGVITYILLCGFPPFANEDNDQDLLFDQILSGSFEFTQPYWDPISDSAKELIIEMLDVDPNHRITAAQIIGHHWLSDDSAGTNDMLNTVSQKLNKHFDKKTKTKPKNCSENMAGISLIAIIQRIAEFVSDLFRTALDKKPIGNVRHYFRPYNKGRNPVIRFAVPLILPRTPF